MKSSLRLLLAVLLFLGVASAAQAAVTITFWSHDSGKSFPHAFVTLRGVPDAGGAPIDVNFGFTAKRISPALLFGPVQGRVDGGDADYVATSDAQFSLVLTDSQYADMLALESAWNEKGSESTYRLNGHNCVHFVKEAARRLGLTGLDHPKLMKKPRSYLQAVAAANVGRITLIALPGKQYLAQLAPIAGPLPRAPTPVSTPSLGRPLPVEPALLQAAH